VIRTLLDAARSLGEVQSTTVFGATLSIRIDSDEDGYDVLDVSWDLVTYEEQDRFPADVLALIPDRGPLDNWDYLPPSASDPGGPGSWFTYISSDWVGYLGTSAEIDDLLDGVDNWSPQNPATDGSEMFSHHAAGHVVTLAYVTGIPIHALCGAVIVAHRDPERLPVCPQCEENLALLRSMRSSDLD